MFNANPVTSTSGAGEAHPLKLEGDARVLWHCLHTPPLPAALRFRGESLHVPVAGVTQTADAWALPCMVLPAFSGRYSSAEPNRKANTCERRRETELGASEPFPCVDRGSPKAEPIVIAQGHFCCCQHLPWAALSVRGRLHLPRPAAPLPSPSPCPPAGTRTWLGVRSHGWSGDTCVGFFFNFMMNYELKTAFAFLKTQCWRRNSKYVVNRNSRIAVCFAFVFPSKVISLPAPRCVLSFSSSSSALLCSCFHPLPGQPALAASVLATAVTYRNMAVCSWSLAALPPNIQCCLNSIVPVPGWETSR